MIPERNIAEMAALAVSHGVALRPHAKTHKSPHIARLQLAACAKLGEAEVLVDQGGDELVVIRDGHVVDHWPVAARGKVR